jgi:hypothetical protein
MFGVYAVTRESVWQLITSPASLLDCALPQPSAATSAAAGRAANQ